MLVEVNGRGVTVENVHIAADEETGRKLALYLYALATGRPGYTEEDVPFSCVVEGESFDEVIRITGARHDDLRLYTFWGVFQDTPIEATFNATEHSGVIHEVQ